MVGSEAHGEGCMHIKTGNGKLRELVACYADVHSGCRGRAFVAEVRHVNPVP